MSIYRTTGHLTDTVNDVKAAQDYLTQYDMTQFLDESLRTAVTRIQWSLHYDGYHYHVEAITNRELTDTELKDLASWVSGQNSDGLGEGFEQQRFAELEGEDEGDWSMCSFDWETNESHMEEVSP